MTPERASVLIGGSGAPSSGWAFPGSPNACRGMIAEDAMTEYKNRYYADLLRNPSFNGVFAGGPPLLTRQQTHELLENPGACEDRARDALRAIRKRYEKARQTARE